jgi:hypothetical protein
MVKTSFQVNLPALAFYDKKLLDKPLKDLTGEEAVIQLQFLSSPYAQQKDKKTGVLLGLIKEHQERINALGQMLAQGFVSFKHNRETRSDTKSNGLAKNYGYK